MTQTAPIAIYGATGYTGRLVVAEARRRGLEIVLAGRSTAKLQRVADTAGVDRAHVRAAAIDDPAALRAALDGCAAVIDCAGPFTLLGEPVVAAAIEAGVHYVDTTGEQPFIKLLADRYDAPARDRGVALVPAMGFDYVPGDLICGLAAREHEPLRELVVAYSVEGFGATRGTMRSALEMLKGGDLAYVEGTWRPAGAGPLRATFAFPEPIGRRPVGKYPSGEIVTVPRHVRTRTVTSLITTAAFAPHPALARAVPFLMPGFGLALRTPIARALDRAIGRLPEGPSEEARRRSRFTIVALAHGEDGRTGRGIVHGSDVYGLTAVTAVHGAELMAAAGFDRAGMHAPATAFDAVEFLNYLGDHGVGYELGEAPVGATA